MRLTDTGIVNNDNTFNGFDIRPYPIAGGVGGIGDGAEYLIVCIRRKDNTRITRTLALKIDKNESGLSSNIIDANRLARLYREAKENRNQITDKHKYAYFSYCVESYLLAWKEYLAGGSDGFNADEWLCVGGRCCVVNEKKYIHRFINHLIVKDIDRKINECLKHEIDKVLNTATKFTNC